MVLTAAWQAARPPPGATGPAPRSAGPSPPPPVSPAPAPGPSPPRPPWGRARTRLRRPCPARPIIRCEPAAGPCQAVCLRLPPGRGRGDGRSLLGPALAQHGPARGGRQLAELRSLLSPRRAAPEPAGPRRAARRERARDAAAARAGSAVLEQALSSRVVRASSWHAGLGKPYHGIGTSKPFV